MASFEDVHVAWLVTSCGPAVVLAVARSWVLPPTAPIRKLPVTETYWSVAVGVGDGDEGEEEDEEFEEEPPHVLARRTAAPRTASLGMKATGDVRLAAIAASLCVRDGHRMPRVWTGVLPEFLPSSSIYRRIPADAPASPSVNTRESAAAGHPHALRELAGDTLGALSGSLCPLGRAGLPQPEREAR
jgi:hypothetical protein